MAENWQQHPLMDGTPSDIVLRTVAAVTGEDPMDLPPLYSAIDPDALDELIASIDQGNVSFSYAGVDLTVSANGKVTIDQMDVG